MEGADEGPAALQYPKLVHLAVLQVKPQIIYISSKSPEYLVDMLHNMNETASSRVYFQAIDIRTERAKVFDVAEALSILSRVHLPQMLPTTSSRDRIHVINTLMNLSAEQQTAATGALLFVLLKDNELESTYRDSRGYGIHLSFLGETSLSGYLMVDPESMEGLGIFNEEDHPSAMGIGRAKEGLSIFGMMNRCVSPAGRRMLRLWFARPLTDLLRLRERQEGIHQLIKIGREIVAAMLNELKAMKDPTSLLHRIQSTQTLPAVEDFLQLRDGLAALLRLRSLINGLYSSNAVVSDTTSFSGTEHQSAVAPKDTEHRNMRQPDRAKGTETNITYDPNKNSLTCSLSPSAVHQGIEDRVCCIAIQIIILLCIPLHHIHVP